MGKNKIPKTILIDFDRTLGYLYPRITLLYDLATILKKHYSKYFELPQEYLPIEQDGYPIWYKLIELAKTRLSPSLATESNQAAEQLVTKYEFERVKIDLQIINGVQNTLKELKSKGFILGLVSNNSNEAVKHALNKLNILDCFEYIGGRKTPFEAKNLKPDPYPLNNAIEKMNVNKKDVCYVGDDITDIIASNRAGIISIGVATGKSSKQELLLAGATYCIDNINNILELV